MKRTIYISVILPLKLEWEPCYSLPEDIQEISPGDRVRVRFANKIYCGVVSDVDITPETDKSKIRSIITIEHNLEKIFQEEIALWRNVAEYYMCSIGEVYKAAYPQGKLDLEEAHAEALQRMNARKERILQSMCLKSERLKERLARKKEQLKVSKEGTKSKRKLLEDVAKLECDIAKAEEAIASAKSSINAPIYDSYRSYSHEVDEIALTEAQQTAYEKIKEVFSIGKPAMLHGVTGSGKTEIYIKAAKEVMSKGQNVLYLVPEIALGRQLEERLYKHFDSSLMTFHSGQSPVSRRNTAEFIRSCRNGRKPDNYIILGTRSSLFLPHHNLGLIIVDEEHDSSYKQDSPAPRYNGRDTALLLHQIHNHKDNKCNIILGSATPSLEEIYNCRSGKHEMIRLNKKYHSAADPEIEIIDTKAERLKNGMTGSFSRKLIQFISNTIENGGQVLILRSRRSWAPVIQCENCGEIQKCPHCNVSMSLHRISGDTMICHYCGYRSTYNGSCIKCKGTLRSIGAGTQKIEEEASSIFPKARIARLDSDTSQRRSFLTRTIQEFSNGNIDILIGTQMLSKGFDFSNLRLVAIIAADALLGMQDFRADEKAFQMLEQLRGRCGRRNDKGRFIIQTAQPEHPIYKRLSLEDSYIYIEDLLKERSDFNFPPFSRIIEISVKDQNEKRLETMSSKLGKVLEDMFPTCVTGPYNPIVDKISDLHIRIIRLNFKKDRQLKDKKTILARAITCFEKNSGYDNHININVDPS